MKQIDEKKRELFSNKINKREIIKEELLKKKSDQIEKKNYRLKDNKIRNILTTVEQEEKDN